MRIEELAFKTNTSVQTINMYYKWAREHPDAEIVRYLPVYSQSGNKQIREWNEDAPAKLLKFRSKIISGRNGFLSEGKQSKGGKNGKKKSSSSA